MWSVGCWVDCFILYTAAVAALHLFIPPPTINQNQEMSPSPTLRPPRSFHHSTEMETPSPPTLRAIFNHNRMSAYTNLSCCGHCGKVGRLQQSGPIEQTASGCPPRRLHSIQSELRSYSASRGRGNLNEPCSMSEDQFAELFEFKRSILPCRNSKTIFLDSRARRLHFLAYCSSYRTHLI